MNPDFDLAIIGSGFGGSLLAMVARRLGLSVALLEKGTHPRFVIGESSTPLANLLLEELADTYGLPRLKPLAKWGAWRAAYPELPVGLKRGFTFFHHRFGEAFSDDDARGRQLLVAASPRDEIADTHWYRPAFDHFLVREAQALGAAYRDRCEVTDVAFTAGGAALTCR
ncbi:MAG TPA: NAD(P)-binding protein, partial [Verrucomicrobiota bacterium]|nr:NAD(P)-binding protein [Verrucomicrobiota bacterium]